MAINCLQNRYSQCDTFRKDFWIQPTTSSFNFPANSHLNNFISNQCVIIQLYKPLSNLVNLWFLDSFPLRVGFVVFKGLIWTPLCWGYYWRKSFIFTVGTWTDVARIEQPTCLWNCMVHLTLVPHITLMCKMETMTRHLWLVAQVDHIPKKTLALLLGLQLPILSIPNKRSVTSHLS